MYHTIGVRRHQQATPMYQSSNYNPSSPVVIMHIYGQTDGSQAYDQYRDGTPSYDPYRDYRDSELYRNEWDNYNKKENRYSDIDIISRRRNSYGRRKPLRLVDR